MAFMDTLKPGIRALVHEYGWQIVIGMLQDGWYDAGKLRLELEVWRVKQQENLLDGNSGQSSPW